MASEMRHLLLVLRKTSLCACGCNGWCTLHAVFRFLLWTFNCATELRWPSTDHNNEPFPEGYRARMAGTAMVCLFALCQIRSDWAEVSHTLGFPSWSSDQFPCFLCHALKATMYTWIGVSCIELPWVGVTDDDIENACRRCEQRIVITGKVMHSQIRMNLTYPKNKAAQGRCIRTDMPQLNPPLLRNDRLEPSDIVPDTGIGFDKMTQYPFTATFWRASQETLVKHRNPIYRIKGLSIHMHMIDALHTVFLGVLHRLIWRCVHCIFAADAFRTGATTMAARRQIRFQPRGPLTPKLKPMKCFSQSNL